MAASATDDDGGEIRETYEEYALGDTRVGLIADPENASAWIQSDRTQTIEP
ncbi:MAG: hypothetical protein ABEJ85_02920 [Haloarculaceae archaeon]